MTVEELIAKLQEQDPTAIVFTQGADYPDAEVIDVYPQRYFPLWGRDRSGVRIS